MNTTSGFTGKMLNFLKSFNPGMITFAIFLCMTSMRLIAQTTFTGYGSGTDGAWSRMLPDEFYADENRARVTANTTNTVTIPATSEAGRFGDFAANDLVLIIEMTACTRASNNWEFNIITSVSPSGTILTFLYNLKNDYCSGGSHAQVIHVPQYSSVTMNPINKITCYPWDGLTGGVIPLMVQGTLTINGSGIDASEKGFDRGIATGTRGDAGAGGAGGSGVGMTAYDGTGGEGITGAGNGGGPFSNGGNDYSVRMPPPSPCCGGNSSGATNESDLNITYQRLLMGGGGWSGTGGQGGGGGGGAGGDAPCCTGGTGGEPGAGGSPGIPGGNGGRGGGIVIIKAQTISVVGSGKIVAKGSDGAPGGDGGRGGNGGTPHPGKGAGAGDGGKGGNGGSGASAGAGGVVFVTAYPGSNGLTSATVILKGGKGDKVPAASGGGHSGNASATCEGCPCPERFCACDEVWAYMLGAFCWTPDSNFPDVRYYDKYVSGTSGPRNSRCIASSFPGGFTITCTDETHDPPCIFHCDMTQVPPAGTDNPNACLSLLCGDHPLPYDPVNYQQCDLYCNPAHFSNEVQCCQGGGGGGRGQPEDGPAGEPGPDGNDAGDGPYMGNNEPPPTPVTPTGTVTNITCQYACNGAVVIFVTGGDLPYHYKWSNGATTKDISGLSPGTYTVTVTDVHSSTGTGSWMVTEPPALAVSSIVANVTCAGATNGMIDLTVLGGTPPYDYLWSNGAVTQDISELAAGTYTVNISDNHGCTITESQAVNTGPPLPAPFSEGFESASFPPACWSGIPVAGSGLWVRSTAASGNGTGTASAFANFYDQVDDIYELKTLPFSISGLVAPVLSFNYAYATYVEEVDEMDVYYSMDNGTTWNILQAMPGGINGILNTGGAAGDPFVPVASQWNTQVLPLQAGTNMLKFRAISAYGNNLYLDNITVMDNSVVPVNTTVQNVSVTGNTCYNASNLITVAGGGTTFTVMSGGYATLMAGQMIRFLPLASVEWGGYMHGLIKPGGPYCYVKGASYLTAPEREAEINPVAAKSFFTIYPNPTTGEFSLEFTGAEESSEIHIEIYGMHGDRLLSEELKGLRKYDLSLAGKPAGVYFIRVVTGKFAGTGKIIRQ